MSREIPTLFTSVLKFIAKQPAVCLTPAVVEKTAAIVQRSEKDGEIDICQLVVNYVAEAGRFTDEAIPPSFFANRKKLSLKNSKITAKYLLQVVDICRESIQSLDISGCFQVDDNVLIDVITRCHQLVHLDIENCRKLSDKGIDGLINSKRKLETINLGGDYNITQKGLKRFLQNFSHLTEVRNLHISGLDINDEIIYAIVNNCSAISSLSISFADISESALSALLDKFGNQLNKLNISWLSQVPAAIHPPISGTNLVDMIFNKCPKLSELDLSGSKALHISNVIQLLDAKIQQIASNQAGCEPLTLLKIKFISTPKATVEAQINGLFTPELVFVT